MTGICKINIKIMLRINYKLIFQNLIGTLVFVAFLGAFAYFCFYAPLFKSDSSKEFSGIVKDKWIHMSETQQGSCFGLKALIQLKTGEKITINCDRKTHDQIKIGALIKRETNGEIKILQ